MAVSYVSARQEAQPSADDLAAEAQAFVALYARGRDYHRVLKSRCHRLMDQIRTVEPSFEGRAFVDSAPVAERSLAAAAGLGWIGRNGCLVVPGLGSYVLLCEIVSNLELPVGAPVAGGCRACDACIRACPTGALLPDGTLDARRCLSYLTIEHEGGVPAEFRNAVGSRVFGCDTCQQACPHNARPVPVPCRTQPAVADGVSSSVGDPELTSLRTPLHRIALAELLAWEPAAWDRATRGSATRRAGYEKLLANAAIAAGACLAQGVPNEKKAQMLARLEWLATHGPCREEAAWALAQAAR